jgi:hypothetical protein
MRDYYARFWCEVGRDLKIVTGKESVLSIIALFLAIPLGYFWGSIQPNQVHPYVMSALSVLGVIFILRLFFALALAPVRLDRTQREESERMEGQLHELLAARARPPSLELARREAVGATLRLYSDAGKDCLRYLLVNGPTEVRVISERTSHDGFADIVGQKNSNDFVVLAGNGCWGINSSLRDALAFHLLRPVTPPSG